jgi:ribosomal-protein-alanine N-acetyltransferase
LLEHLLTLALAANATIVLLEVRKSNKAAIALYEKYGFKRLGVRKGYYPAANGREDALVLAFDIP